MAAFGGRSRRRYDGDDRGRRRSGGSGCLWYALIFILVMLILSLMFGGFHKGHLHPNGAPSVSGIAPMPVSAI
ncbi:MAG: hypothetical protein HOV87_28770 [Catenulispora sp.]|nr:hypothetical protein [Catenulispora sp.]